MPDVFGHGAEGVCTAGHEGIHAAGAHVHEQRPGVVVILNICHIQSGHKPPREEPEGQQVSPDVEGLVCHLEKAEDTGSGRTLWMSVAKEDALFMENLWHLVYAEQPGELHAQHLEGELGRPVGGSCSPTPGPTQSSDMVWGTCGQLVPGLLPWVQRVADVQLRGRGDAVQAVQRPGRSSGRSGPQTRGRCTWPGW